MKGQTVSERTSWYLSISGLTEFPVCPHASFVHDGILAGTPPRESIEARIIVVTSKSETVTADL